MNILGVELEFDFFEADNVDKFESELKKVQEDIKEPTQYEGKSTGEQLKLQCGIVKKFFDTVFGDGTAKKIFGDKNNIKTCMEAFAMCVDASTEAQKELRALTNKYQPNRAERRAGKHGKNHHKNNQSNAAMNGNR